MHYRKYPGIHLAAILMAFLVICIPFYTSSVFAATGSISNVYVHGTEEKDSFLSANGDFLRVSLDARITNNDGSAALVSPWRVRYTIDGSAAIPFDECNHTQHGIYRCTYISDVRNWESREYALSLILYDDAFIRLDTYRTGFFVDSKAPVFLSLEIPDGITAGDFEIPFTIEDRACDGCIDICSGNNRIELFSDGSLVHTHLIETDFCKYTDKIKTTAESLNIDEGLTNLCIRAHDNAGNYAEVCKELLVDYNAPVFIPGSFLILNKNKNPVIFSSPYILESDIMINISETEGALLKENVIADFSGLFTTTPGQYESVAADSCVSDGQGNYLCTWESINIHGVDGETEIYFNAEDSSGNSASYTHKILIPLDTGRPVVMDVRSQNEIESQPGPGYYNSSENVFIVTVAQSGAGMMNADAYLDLGSIHSAYSIKKADECIDKGGKWDCYWYGISAGQKNPGAVSNVRVTRLRDDSGISFAAEEGVIHRSFIYDSEPPVISDIHIGPFGSELEVLMDGDVVLISAVVSDSVSGVNKDKVIADYSDFDESQVPTPARSCMPLYNGSARYACTWEYAGPLPVGSMARVGITAVDNAGNPGKKAYASIFVAETEETETDFWHESFSVGRQKQLNPNFLWQSRTGTAIRADAMLIPKAGMPYVHAFEITECKGKLDIGDAKISLEKKSDKPEQLSLQDESLSLPDEGSNLTDEADTARADDYESYTILNQYHYPGMGRESKYLIINIPNYQKEYVNKAKKLDIVCTGEVVQASSKMGKIYVPNEKVTAEFSIPLMHNSLFIDPAFSTVNKVHHMRDRVDMIDSVLKFITTITSWLGPICIVISTVRQLLTNICTIWIGIKAGLSFVTTVFDGNVDSCNLQIDFLEKLWYGVDGKQERDNHKISDSTDKNKIFGSTKSYMSVGFWCDLVVCEECNDVWRGIFQGGGGQDSFSFETLGFLDNLVPDSVSQKDASNINIKPDVPTAATHDVDAKRLGTSTIAPQVYFDPMRNLIVALVCVPPCLKGIENNLRIYRQIIVTYNVCMNTAAIRGEDTSQCDDYYASQVCQQILGWFWSIVDAFIMQFLVKSIMFLADSWIFSNPHCPPKCETTGCYSQTNSILFATLCIPKILMGIASWWWTVQDTLDRIKSLGELEFGGNSEKDVQKLVDEEMDLSDDEFMKKYGEYPDY